MKQLFVGPHGLRAGWRVAIFAAIFAVAAFALQVLFVRGLGYRAAPSWNAADLLIVEAISLASVLIALWSMSRLERRHPLRDYALPLHDAFGRRWLAGVIWGSLTVGVLVAIIGALGGVSVHGLALSGSALARAAVLWAIAMIVLALFEESLFRGYPQLTLMRSIGFWPAAALLSVLFGATHYLIKPMENAADVASIVCLGLFLCLTLRRTGTLWFAVGFHAAFDYAALIIVGAPNTGNAGRPVADHLLATNLHGAEWLTGGPRGIEASLVIFPVLALLIFLFDRLYPAARAESLRDTLATPTPAEGTTPVA